MRPAGASKRKSNILVIALPTLTPKRDKAKHGYVNNSSNHTTRNHTELSFGNANMETRKQPYSDRQEQISYGNALERTCVLPRQAQLLWQASHITPSRIMSNEFDLTFSVLNHNSNRHSKSNSRSERVSKSVLPCT